MKAKAKLQLPPLLFASLLALVPSCAFGTGLAAIKEQAFHSDAGATAVVYSSLMESGASVKIETTNRTFTVEGQKLVGKVEIMPSIPPTITTESELGIIQKTLKDYQNFTTRFPKSAAILANHISALDACIKEFEGGRLRYNGKWMAKDEALSAKQKDEQATQAVVAEANQMLREKVAFEESQKAKGLAKRDDKWIPLEEAQRLAERDQAALNDAVNLVAKAEKQAAEEKAFIAKNTVRLQGQIRQIANDGLLIHAHLGNEGRPNFDSGTNRPKLFRGEFLLTGHPDGGQKVDNDWFDVDAVPDGIFEYSTVLGASKRVHKFRVIKSYY